jgi:BlaI family transcriptional regulator, penicillinase repressor
MPPSRPALAKREKEILDIVYALGHATAGEVRNAMRNPPTDAGVRTIMRVLVDKKHLRIEQDGQRYVYWPTVSRESAQKSELQHVMRTFFGGSVENTLATLLEVSDGRLDDEQRRKLKRLIDQAAKEGR